MHTCIYYGFVYSSDGLLTLKTNSYLVKYLHWQRQKTSLQYIGAITLLSMTANVLSNNQQQTLAPDIGWNAADKLIKPSTNTGNGKQSRNYYNHQERPNSRTPEWKKTLSIKSVMKKIMKLTKEDLKSERQKNITGRTIETWTNRYKDHHKYKYETVIASSGSLWTIIIQINFIKQHKM